MNLPRELHDRGTIQFFLGSCFIFLVLSVLMEMDRGVLQGLLPEDMAFHLGLTAKFAGTNWNWLDEDGPVENLTAILALFSALLLFVAYILCRRDLILRTSSDTIPMLGLVFLMVFFAGEEISWGQRILLFDTPAFLRDINEQHEFSLHNLRYVHLYKDGLLAIAILIWGVILPLARLYLPSVRRFQTKLWLPLPPIRFVAFFAAAIGFRVVFKPLYGDGGQEVLEFLFAVAMFLVSLYAVYRPRDLFDLK